MAVTTALPTSIADLSIRQISESDIPALQQLCTDCTDFHVLTKGEPPGSSEAAKLISGCPPGKCPEDKEQFGLFTTETQRVGVIDLLMDFPESSTWYIGLMMLHPQWRGQGLGRDLLTWVEGYLSSKKVQHLCLGGLDINPRGQKFWEGAGFKQVREVPNFQSGKLSTTTHVMKKQIQH
jgi:ribosomal protein S18 acetylase RimI-like enzyme